MQDHIFEEFADEQERETVDSLAELEHFWHARGDDRTEFSPYDFTIADRSTSRPPRLTRCGPASDPSEGAGCSGNRKEAA